MDYVQYVDGMLGTRATHCQTAKGIITVQVFRTILLPRIPKHSETIRQVNGNVTNPYAYLEVQMQQEPDSWEIVTEIDPLNVEEILGSIGGFWGEYTVTENSENGACALQLRPTQWVRDACYERVLRDSASREVAPFG